jgi:hypothetical protein
MDTQQPIELTTDSNASASPKSGILTKIAILPVVALNAANQLVLFHPKPGESKEYLASYITTKIALVAFVGPLFLAWLLGFSKDISGKYSSLARFLFFSLVVLFFGVRAVTRM